MLKESRERDSSPGNTQSRAIIMRNYEDTSKPRWQALGAQGTPIAVRPTASALVVFS